jgi:hypothetical protein
MREPKPKEKYRHYKGKDRIYEIVAIARDCDNPEKKLVIYKSLYHDYSMFPEGTIWSRLLDDFVGYKTLADKTKVKRFMRTK